FTFWTWTDRWEPGGPSFRPVSATDCLPALRESHRWAPRCGRCCCWDCPGCCAARRLYPARSALPALQRSVLLVLSWVSFVCCAGPRLSTDEPAGAQRLIFKHCSATCRQTADGPRPPSSSPQHNHHSLTCGKPPRRQRDSSGASGHLTAGAFVPRIVRVVLGRIVVARITGRARGDPLLQLFHFEQKLFLVFHLISPPFVS